MPRAFPLDPAVVTCQGRVAVDDRDNDGKPAPAADRQRLQKHLEKLAGPNALIEVAKDAAKASWLIRVHEGMVYLVPAAGWAEGDPTTAQDAKKLPLFGPAPLDDTLEAWLHNRLGSIARATSLKRLAAASPEALLGGDIAVDAKIELRRCQDDNDKKDQVGRIAIPWPSSDVTLHDGDLIVFHVTNTGRVPIDVSLIYVDSGYGIECLYPRQNDFNRLQPGEADTLPKPRIRLDGKTSGLEHMVVIVTNGSGLAMDFSGLEQPTLEKAKGRGAAARGMETPLGKLLQKGLYGQGTARAGGRGEIQDHRIALYSWRLLPEKRPLGKE